MEILGRELHILELLLVTMSNLHVVRVSLRTCSICIKVFEDDTQLFDHKRNDHREKERPFECKLCYKTFTDIYYLHKHESAEHSGESKCEICGDIFPSKSKMFLHKYKHKERQFGCDHCQMSFRKEYAREKHIKRTHLKEKNVSCDKCEYKGFALTDVRTHILIKHSDKRPYQCQLCPSAFKRVTSLYTHQETHNETRDFPCNICGKMCKTENVAKMCAKAHKEKGEFTCEFEGCGLVVAYAKYLRRHMRNHLLPTQQFPCNSCDKTYRNKSDVKRHQLYDHGKAEERTIPCLQCPKKWRSKVSLRRHMLTHTDTTPIQCPHPGCETKMSLQYNMNHHMKVKHGKVNHRTTVEERESKLQVSKEKHPCKICKIVLSIGRMKGHMKMHNECPPLVCPVQGCAEQIFYIQNRNHHGFNFPAQFYRHLETEHRVDFHSQTLVASFQCKICGKSQLAKSSNPRKSKTFWHKNSKIWSTILRKHLVEDHPDISTTTIDLKNDWENFYHKAVIAFMDGNSIEDKEMEDEIKRGNELKKIRKVDPSSKSPERRKMANEKVKVSFKCDQCGKAFKGPKSLDTHMIFHRNLRPFCCGECGTTFKRKTNLKNHLVFHGVERPFPCIHCEKAFKTKMSLKCHTRTHNGDRPYACTSCGKTFSQVANLNRHKQTQHTLKINSCKDCGDTFKTNYDLNVHILEHGPNKPFPCGQCRRGFKRQIDLDQHMLTHTGEKPFQCSNCWEKFGRKSSLKSHEQAGQAETVSE